MDNETIYNAASPILLKEGDRDEYLGKQIYFLVRRNRDYIVYLDEDYCIEWWTMALRLPPPESANIKTAGQLESDARAAELRVRCLNWEAVLDTMDGGPDDEAHDENKKELNKKRERERRMFRPFRRQLAEIVAETLGSGGPHVAEKLLVEVEGRIKSLAAMRARMWLLNTAYFGAAVLGVMLLLTVPFYVFKLGGHTVEQLMIVLLCCIMGGLGAVLSVLIRSSQLEIDFAAGEYVHQREGMARLLMGVFAGLVTFLLLKSGVFFSHLVNGATNTAQVAVLLLLCTVSGTSERLVKSFLSKIEEKAYDPTKAQAKAL